MSMTAERTERDEDEAEMLAGARRLRRQHPDWRIVRCAVCGLPCISPDGEGVHPLCVEDGGGV